MNFSSDKSPRNNEIDDNPLNLSTAMLEEVDAVCLEFEKTWRTGARPDLTGYLSKVSPPARPALLQELISLDVDYRKSEGESPARADYVDSLPSDRELIETIFDRADRADTSMLSDSTNLRQVITASSGGSKTLPELLGRYRVLELVGEGGFGVVYRARDTQLKRDVAIKVPHSRLDGHVQATRLFRNEAQTVARLRHPAIVPVFDVHFDPDRLSSCYVVSQFMEGSNLAEYATEHQVPATEAATIVARIAEALHYAHETGLVHRDVKLSNILRDSNGDVFIADFGLAICDEQVVTGEGFVGTPAVMSPEQARGDAKRVDRRSDIYGLGAVLYELLTGQRPFTEQRLDKLLEQVTSSSPQPPRQLDSTIPVELERICLRALAKQPADRFSSAQEMAEELRAFRGDAPKSRRHRLKWLAFSAPIIAVALLWFLAWPKSSSDVGNRPKPDVRSLAVLPFDSIGIEDATGYLGMGMADCLHARLGNLRQIAVRPPLSARNLVTTIQDPSELGRKLKVDAILKGSTLKTNDGVQTKVQLVQVSDGTTLWSRTFDHSMANTLEIQDTISAQVANILVSQLTADERERVERRPTSNQQAYEAYVKGRYHWNQRSTGGTVSIDKAIQHFKSAIDADPLFARAYAGLAESYALSNTWSPTMDEQALPRARAAALKALEIDSELHEAHATLALVLFYHDWNFEGSEKEFRRAIELNPNYATTHQWFGETLYFRERFDESIEELKKASTLDPLSEVIASLQGSPHLFRRDYEKAKREYHRTLKVHPKSVLALWGLAVASEAQGQIEQALGYYQRTGQRHSQAYLLAKLGRIDEAKKIRQEYMAREPFPSHPYNVALIDIGLKDYDSAFEQLQKAIEIRDERIVWLKVDPRLDPIRNDPRFTKLLKEVGWTD